MAAAGESASLAQHARARGKVAVCNEREAVGRWRASGVALRLTSSCCSTLPSPVPSRTGVRRKGSAWRRLCVFLQEQGMGESTPSTLRVVSHPPELDGDGRTFVVAPHCVRGVSTCATAPACGLTM